MSPVLERPEASPRRPGITEVAGRLVEISGSVGSPSLTLAFDLVVEAQQSGEPTAWLTSTSAAFYPPDAARHGADLDALIVVRLPRAIDLVRAADKLVHSGAFGLVVIDPQQPTPLSTPLLSRLVATSKKHGTAVVFITEKSASQPSLDPLVSLRLEPRRAWVERGRFAVESQAIKDKRNGPGWRHTARYSSPPGLVGEVPQRS